MKLKKVILFTLLFASVLLFVACDKEEHSDKDNRKEYYDTCEKEGHKEYYDNGALRSITTYCNDVQEVISFYENGKVWVKGLYKAGLLDGIRREWHENGQIRLKEYYKAGKPDGDWIEWYADGKMKVYRKYKDGTLYVFRVWLENGNLRFDKTFSNGECPTKIGYRGHSYVYKDCSNHSVGDGFEKRWHNNGRLEYEEYFKDGKRDGAWKTWYESGLLESVEYYKAGKKDSVWEAWYKNGQQRSKEIYKDDKLEGVRKTWFENGKLESEESYANGEKEGVSKIWYENGRLKEKGIYKNGKMYELKIWYGNGRLEKQEKFPEGKSSSPLFLLFKGMCHSIDGFEGDGYVKSWYYENGQLMYEGAYKSSKKVGVWKVYHENGRLAFEGSYKNGEPDGIWKEWDENGMLKNEGTYKFDGYDGDRYIGEDRTWTKWNRIGGYECSLKPDPKAKYI